MLRKENIMRKKKKEKAGRFDILEVNDTYLVNEEEGSASQKSAPNPKTISSNSTTSIGTPLSTNQCQEISWIDPFVRPTFRWPSPKISWWKSILVVDVLEDGTLQELFQTILTMTEEMSSVTRVTNMLKDQLNYFTLLDSKYLRTVENNSTQGKFFIDRGKSLLR